MDKNREVVRLDVKDAGSSTALDLISLGVGLATVGIVGLPVDQNRYRASVTMSDGATGTGRGRTRDEAAQRASQNAR